MQEAASVLPVTVVPPPPPVPERKLSVSTTVAPALETPGPERVSCYFLKYFHFHSSQSVSIIHLLLPSINSFLLSLLSLLLFTK